MAPIGLTPYFPIKALYGIPQSSVAGWSIPRKNCRSACWDRGSTRGCHTSSLAEISLWHCGHATSTLRAGSERLRTVLWISTALPCRYAQALTVTFGHRLPKIFSHLNQARPVREIGLL